MENIKTLFTPCVLQTLIICCTFIITCVIGISAYRISKNQEQKWGNYIFNASLLIVIAVMFFSISFYKDKMVLDFISLSSALISIILAIITIIYSFYSNSQSISQVNSLNKAVDSVEQATNSYSKTAKQLQENIQSIIESVNRVEIKTDYLLRTNSFFRQKTNQQ